MPFFQDHLELFFGSLRSALGANNNPSCQQFKSIYKKLLVKLEIQDVRGNCQRQDSTSLLVVSSSQRSGQVQDSTEALNFINHNVSQSPFDKDMLVRNYYCPGMSETQLSNNLF